MSLYVYWCPRCQVQSSRPFHECEGGSSLLPHVDDETECERIEVVPKTRVERVEAKLEEMNSELTIERGNHRAMTEDASGFRRALMQIRELDEDDFKSAYKYQEAVRFIANNALLSPKSVPR